MMTFGVFIIVLGILVFIHEFGHFVFAKRAGVRVETFSLGFGPRLFGWKRGETDYRISAVPLGGYVKMTGEDPKDEDADREDSFAKKSVAARMKIVLAGPLMNLILPLFLMPLVYIVGIEQPAYLDEPAVVGWVEQDTPAAAAGFRPGDRIVRIQGEEISTWERAKILFASNPNQLLRVEFLRDDKPMHAEITPDSSGYAGGYTGLDHERPALIGSVSPDMPAEKAGLQAGDRIVAINGAPIHYWGQMAAIIRAHPDDPLQIEIKRDGEASSVTVTPALDPETQSGLLGIAYQERTIFKRYGLWKSVQNGIRNVGQSFVLTFYVLGKLLTGGLSIKTLGGPILIAKMTGDAARVGLSSLISFVAFLSLQLGILNLLPIPVLDGGHVLFLTLESLLRRPVNIKIREAAQQVGFIMLLVFILIISYNDIRRILPIQIEELFK
jgi:regulator of sigma E protease